METYTVRCHCGSVRAKVRCRKQCPLIVWDCNCSDCSKRGNKHFIVPSTDFELDMKDFESATTLYTWGTNTAIRRFCNTCAILPFYTPRSNPDDVAITLACVDFGDSGAPPIEVQKFDGVHWEESYTSTGIVSQSKKDVHSPISDKTAESSINIAIEGDGDVWVENKRLSPNTGKQRTYVNPTNTGRNFCDKPSSKVGKVRKSSLHLPIAGDGDVWVEKKFTHSESGEKRIYFCSTKTRRKVLNEPPTGAGKVVRLPKDTLMVGDGDVWVEKKFQNSKTGKQRSFFFSTNTGRKVRDEPPSGASKIVYL